MICNCFHQNLYNVQQKTKITPTTIICACGTIKTFSLIYFFIHIVDAINFHKNKANGYNIEKKG